MEYLLMHDDSVVAINKVLKHHEVMALLNNVEGATAYYWYSPDFQWSSFVLDSQADNGSCVTHELSDVPDVIKLARMLE